MNFLQLLPLSRPRLEVLFEIYAEREDYLRHIAKRLTMNPSLAFSILKKLHQTGFIMKRKVGKEVQYSLQPDRASDLLVGLLEEFHLEKALERSVELKTVITLLLNNKLVLSSSQRIYLFGSFALGNFTKESDIDILFVTAKPKLISRNCREISAVVGRTISPLIYTQKKFQQELSAQEPLLSSIVNTVRQRVVIKS